MMAIPVIVLAVFAYFRGPLDWKDLAGVSAAHIVIEFIDVVLLGGIFQ